MKLTDYIRGLRRGSGAHRTELEAMRDPLLGDALEGYDKVQGDHLPTLRRLEERIAERTRTEAFKPEAAAMPADGSPRRLRRWRVAVAAAVIVLAIGGTALLLLQRQSLSDSEPLVAQEIELPASPATPRETAVTVPDEKTEIVEQTKISEPKPEKPQIPAEPVAEDAAVETKTPVSPISNALAGSVAGVVADVTSDHEIEDVVVVGYGTQKKSSLTGAITPTAEIISAEKAADTQIISSLAGSVPGITPGHSNVPEWEDVSDGAVLDEVVVTALGAQRRVSVTGAVGVVKAKELSVDLVDTVTTAAFKRYMAVEIANSNVAGSATLEFEINSRGRPYRIDIVESTSKEAAREAVRILRGGPDWKLTPSRKRVVVTFR